MTPTYLDFSDEPMQVRVLNPADDRLVGEYVE